LIVIPLARQYPVRYAASDADILGRMIKSSKQVSRVSRQDDRAGKLITAIRDRDYAKAESLVKRNGLNPNSHDWNENTALTDAAKRGDVDGVSFILGSLGANPYASCDCPHHKTAYHYASENGHAGVLEVLLKYGNIVNVLDSRKYTPLDLAKDDKTRKILIEAGSKTGNLLPEYQKQLYLPKT